MWIIPATMPEPLVTSASRDSRRAGTTARITNGGDATFRLQLLVDGMPQDNELSLPAAELADGGFAFEYCCGRSFAVDNVRVEASPPPTNTVYAQAQRTI